MTKPRPRIVGQFLVLTPLDEVCCGFGRTLTCTVMNDRERVCTLCMKWMSGHYHFFMRVREGLTIAQSIGEIVTNQEEAVYIMLEAWKSLPADERAKFYIGEW